MQNIEYNDWINSNNDNQNQKNYQKEDSEGYKG